MTRSITFRLTVLFAAVSTIVLMAMAYLLHSSVERHFEEQDLQQMQPKLELARTLWSHMQSLDELDAFRSRLLLALAGHTDMSLVLSSADGKRIFATDGTALPEALTAGLNGKGVNAMMWRDGERHLRGVAAVAASATKDVPAATVAVVLDIGSHDIFVRDFQRSLWTGLALSLLAAAALGWAAVRLGLGPVHRVAALARSMTASRLTERLSTEAVPRELAELAAAFNAMLERLQDSFRRLSEFSSDLAHELRTPIAVLTTQTQVAVSRVRSADEYREVLYSNLEVLERMARIAEDMLYLAKADNGLAVPRSESVRLHAEVAELFDFYAVLAEDKRVRLTLEGEQAIKGDRLMLRRALGNLLSNAIRHTPEEGEVRVSLRHTPAGQVEIEVTNTGADIPPEHLPHLFERFYRVDNSAAARAEGTGLGLAITRAIVEAHGGKIRARSASGSVAFIMAFPAS